MMDKDNADKNVEKTGSTTSIKRIWKALYYSLDGLKATFKHEAAFRQEIILTGVLLILALLLPFSVIERILLIGSIILVLIVELLNSAVEWCVDYISTDIHPLGKRIKDMASAAVFLSLVNCGIVWILLLAGNWSEIIFWLTGEKS